MLKIDIDVGGVLTDYEGNKAPKRSHKKHMLANNWTELDELVNNLVIKQIDKEEPFYLSNIYTIKKIHDKAIFIE